MTSTLDSKQSNSMQRMLVIREKSVWTGVEVVRGGLSSGPENIFIMGVN